MKILIHIVVTAFALLLAAHFVPGIVVSSFYTALVAAVILGILNVLVKPVLFVLTFPITLLTFGLFSFVLNAVLFWFAASILDGFAVSGFIPALIGSIVVSVISTVAHTVLG